VQLYSMNVATALQSSATVIIRSLSSLWTVSVLVVIADRSPLHRVSSPQAVKTSIQRWLAAAAAVRPIYIHLLFHWHFVLSAFLVLTNLYAVRTRRLHET